ncbi:MAG: protein kinase [Acidobacteriota bacterium]|nr:protein kinase [Acidobacteriota bacterium]
MTLRSLSSPRVAAMPLPAQTRLGPYRILAPLGAGGMGEVYRAQDAHLDREVALKVLPEAFARDPDRLRRFEHEARMLSALNHPNILAIHDLGNEGGAPYLVMELLEGETLRQRLQRQPLPGRRVVALALQVAAGLSAAHEKGILHRDLKPGNLFLCRDGRVKILDFGLAKVAGPSGPEGDTRTGLSGAEETVGTPGYMSPEQVRGEPLDARSDLFSLGVVMWEMLSGQNPFQRDSAVETLHATLKEEPPDLDPGLRIPPDLARIVDTCLAKDPAARFHSAHDLAFALERLEPSLPSPATGPFPGFRPASFRRKGLPLAATALATGVLTAAAAFWWPRHPASPPYDPRCVAILPFENRTGDASLEPLGQRVVELLRQDLQLVEDLRVAPDVPASGPSALRRVAETTRARFVAAGSYYLEGGELAFLGCLEDPWSGRVIYQLGPWRAPIRQPGPALAELRQRMGGAVAWSYDNAFRYPPGAVRPPRLDTLQMYQKVMNEYGATPTRNLMPRFEQAIALDPDFFPLRLDAFDAWTTPGMERMDKGAEQVAAMEARVDRTPVERNLARMARAALEGWREDMLKAEEELAALMPDTPLVQLRLAQGLAAMNRPGRAIPILQRVPDDWAGKDAAVAPMLLYTLCWAHHARGDYAAELEAARAAQARAGGLLSLRLPEVSALVGLGRVDEVQRLLSSLSAATLGRGGTGGPMAVRHMAMIEFWVHGPRDEARRLAEQQRVEILEAPPAFRKTRRVALVRALLCLDRPEEALPICRELSSEAPDLILFQGFLGATLARLGRGDEARQVEARLAGLTRPYLRGDHTYWRACIAAQLGEKDRAVELLRKAFAQGKYLDYFGATHREIFLEPLWGYPPFEELTRLRG